MNIRILLGCLCLFVNYTIGQAQISNHSEIPELISSDTSANIDPSALLELRSTDQGLLIPRMTITERDAISPAAQGLLVYVTDTNSFWHYDGNIWIELGGLQASLVDSDTDTKIEVDKGADEDQISMTLANQELIRISRSPFNDPKIEILNTRNNVFLGLNVGANIAVTGTNNTFLGHQAGLANDTGDSNTFVGSDAGSSNKGGTGNTFIGTSAGVSNQTGFSNTFIGKSSGRFTDPNKGFNVFIGNESGFSNDGNSNVFVGVQAGFQNMGDRNVFLGNQSGLNVNGNPGLVIFPSDNVYIGSLSGANNQLGSQNIAIGTGAGQNNDGTGNVFLGNTAGQNTTGSNQLMIDNTNTTDPLIYGQFDTDELEINGDLDVEGDLDVANDLEVTGDLEVIGDIRSTSGMITSCSDVRFKRNILPLTNALSTLQSIHGVSYYWKQEEFPQMQFNNREQIGILAQDVEQVFPQMVLTDRNGYKRVDYTRLTPVLLEAIKEQQTQIKSLQSENELMKADIEWLKEQVEALKK